MGDLRLKRQEFVTMGKIAPHFCSTVIGSLEGFQKDIQRSADPEVVGRFFDMMDKGSTGEVFIEGIVEFLHSHAHSRLKEVIESLQGEPAMQEPVSPKAGFDSHIEKSFSRRTNLSRKSD